MPDEAIANMDPGSFNHYLGYSGGFVTTIALAIQKADQQNQARLKVAFPQMVAAFQMGNWNHAPEGFSSPQYGAHRYGFAGHLERLAARLDLVSDSYEPFNRLAHLADRDILYIVQAEDVRTQLENRGTFPNLVDQVMVDESFLANIAKALEEDLRDVRERALPRIVEGAFMDWTEPGGASENSSATGESRAE